MTEERTSFLLKLPTDLMEEIRRLAEQERRSATNWMVVQLEYAVEKTKRERKGKTR